MDLNMKKTSIVIGTTGVATQLAATGLLMLLFLASLRVELTNTYVFIHMQKNKVTLRETNVLIFE